MHALADHPLAYLSVGFLLLFAAVAAIDGVYIHLWKLRLHTRAASFAEHLWHTASAVLFVPTVLVLFVWPSAGAVLYAGLAALVVTHVVEVFDVRAERESRRELGGVSRFELGIHVAAVATRSAAVLLLLLARPGAIWSPDGTAQALPPGIAMFGSAIAAGAVGIAALHVVLAAMYCAPFCRPRVAIGGRA